MRFWVKLFVMSALLVGAGGACGYQYAMYRIVQAHNEIDERYRRGEHVPAERVRALDEALYKIDPPTTQPVWEALRHAPTPTTGPSE